MTTFKKAISFQNILKTAPFPILENELEELLPIFYQLIQICLRRGLTGLTLLNIGYHKTGFVYLKKNGEYQIVINPFLEKIGKDISILEGPKKLIERSKEIKVDFLTPKDGKLIKIEKILEDEEAIEFQQLYDMFTKEGLNGSYK